MTEESLPPVDRRLVAPGSGYEIEDGLVRKVERRDEPRATRLANVAALLEVHVKDAFAVAIDMLTRTSALDDVAPEASVFPLERDAETGGRQIEALAFETASKESLGRSGIKAKKLVGRGVRRVFAIEVVENRVYEWSRELDGWRELERGSKIEDSVFAVALGVDDLLERGSIDDAVARALLAKGNPVLMAALAEREEQGRLKRLRELELEEKHETILYIAKVRRISLPDELRARLLATRDDEALRTWFAAAATSSTTTELLAKLG